MPQTRATPSKSQGWWHAQLGIAACLLITTGCSLLFHDPPPNFAGGWSGCYRGGDPETGVILETVFDEDGDRTAMLTGCFAIGIGTPSPQMGTLAGVAENEDEIEMSDGEFLYILQLEDRDTETRLDDTITLISANLVITAIPSCGLATPPTCEELLGG